MKNSPSSTSKEHCKNCSTALQHEAHFCQQCGQPVQLKSFGIWNVIHSFFDQYIAVEGTLWRSLNKLILQPGKLSIDYMDGKRARYVGPVRLFFSISFVFILCMSFLLENSQALQLYYSELLFSGSETAIFELLKSAFVMLIALTLSYAGLIWLAKAIHRLSFGNALLASLHFHSFTMLLILVGSALFWLTSGTILVVAEWFIVALLALYMALMLWQLVQHSKQRHWAVKSVLVIGLIALYLFFYVGFMRGFIEGFFLKAV